MPMLMPNWFHIRKASFIRGGIDYKKSLGKILLYKNFCNPGEYIDGLQKFQITLKYEKVYEQQEDKIKGNALIVFKGDLNFFEDLYDHCDFLRDELYRNLCPDLREVVNKTEVHPIVMNVRRGRDFKDAKSLSDYTNKGAIRTPLSWFLESLIQIREIKGQDVPALIISDGSSYDLQVLLNLPNVTLADSPTAITDLLLLSKAKLILGSGGSSFSAWGAFLSKAITLSIPGQSLQWFKVSRNINEHFVGTHDPKYPDKKILNLINEKL